jgi:hypothetical protein
MAGGRVGARGTSPELAIGPHPNPALLHPRRSWQERVLALALERGKPTDLAPLDLILRGVCQAEGQGIGELWSVISFRLTSSHVATDQETGGTVSSAPQWSQKR